MRGGGYGICPIAKEFYDIVGPWISRYEEVTRVQEQGYLMDDDGDERERQLALFDYCKRTLSDEEVDEQVLEDFPVDAKFDWVCENELSSDDLNGDDPRDNYYRLKYTAVPEDRRLLKKFVRPINALKGGVEKNITISSVKINDFTAELIATLLRQNKIVTNFEMSHCEISEKGLIAILSSLEDNQSITQISFWGSGEFTCQVINALSIALSKNQTLKRVSLDETEIGDDEVVPLAEILIFNQTIESLSIAGNRFDYTKIGPIIDAWERNYTFLNLAYYSSIIDGDLGDENDLPRELLRKINELHSRNKYIADAKKPESVYAKLNASDWKYADALGELKTLYQKERRSVLATLKALHEAGRLGTSYARVRKLLGQRSHLRVGQASAELYGAASDAAGARSTVVGSASAAAAASAMGSMPRTADAHHSTAASSASSSPVTSGKAELTSANVPAFPVDQLRILLKAVQQFKVADLLTAAADKKKTGAVRFLKWFSKVRASTETGNVSVNQIIDAVPGSTIWSVIKQANYLNVFAMSYRGMPDDWTDLLNPELKSTLKAVDALNAFYQDDRFKPNHKDIDFMLLGFVVLQDKPLMACIASERDAVEALLASFKIPGLGASAAEDAVSLILDLHAQLTGDDLITDLPGLTKALSDDADAFKKTMHSFSEFALLCKKLYPIIRAYLQPQYATMASIIQHDVEQLFKTLRDDPKKAPLVDCATVFKGYKDAGAGLAPLPKEIAINALDLRGVAFVGHDRSRPYLLAAFEFIGFNFGSAQFNNVSFSGASLKQCDFEEAQFKGHIDLSNLAIDAKTAKTLFPLLVQAESEGVITLDTKNMKLVEGDFSGIVIPTSSSLSGSVERAQGQSSQTQIAADNGQTFLQKPAGKNAFIIFGLTRDAAKALLDGKITEITSVLLPFIEDALLSPKFQAYLLDEQSESVPDVLSKETFDAYRAALASRMPTITTEGKIKAVANDATVVSAFLSFLFKDKTAWPDPSVLFALAHIQEIQLRLWIKNSSEKLIPHGKYPHPAPVDSKKELLNLLIQDDDAFEVLNSVDVDHAAGSFFDTLKSGIYGGSARLASAVGASTERIRTMSSWAVGSGAAATDALDEESKDEALSVAVLEEAVEDAIAVIKDDIELLQEDETENRDEIAALRRQMEQLEASIVPMQSRFAEKQHIRKERQMLLQAKPKEIGIYYQKVFTQLCAMFESIYLLQCDFIQKNQGAVTSVSAKVGAGSSTVGSVKAGIAVTDIAVRLGTAALQALGKGLGAAKKIPLIGAVADVAKAAADEAENVFDYRNLVRANSAFLGLSPKMLEKLADQIARRLTLTYQEQIALLTEKGAMRFAECSALRIVACLFNDLIKDDDFVGNAVKAVRAYTVHQNRVKFEATGWQIGVPFSDQRIESKYDADKRWFQGKALNEDMLHRRTGLCLRQEGGAPIYFSNDANITRGRQKMRPVPESPETHAALIGYIPTDTPPVGVMTNDAGKLGPKLTVSSDLDAGAAEAAAVASSSASGHAVISAYEQRIAELEATVESLSAIIIGSVPVEHGTKSSSASTYSPQELYLQRVHQRALAASGGGTTAGLFGSRGSRSAASPARTSAAGAGSPTTDGTASAASGQG